MNSQWIAVLPGALILVACSMPGRHREAVPAPQIVTTASGLIYEVAQVGTGPAARAGDRALIHETVKLANGIIIVDTWAMNHPVLFLLGGNQAIAGVDEAVTGMRVGERRRVVIPPSLSRRQSYPDNGLFGPDDTLYYDITLLQTTNP